LQAVEHGELALKYADESLQTILIFWQS
jgi:hypothetical protein